VAELRLQEPPLVKSVVEEGGHLFDGLFLRTLLIDRARIKWKFIPWAIKGGLAILDQALFAGTNFLVNVLLGRWLTSAQYGAFAVVYSLFFLFSTFHAAVLTEPMMVFGPGKYAPDFRKYVGMLLCGHLSLMMPVSLILLVAASVAGHFYPGGAEQAFLGLAAAAPLILLLWLLRQTFYIRLQPGWSAVGGVLYLVFFLAVVLMLRAQNRLSPMTVFLGMGAGALAASIFLLIRLQPRWTRGPENLTARLVASEHWRYGRWSIAAVAVQWFPSNIYYSLLPAWMGLAASGALRAFANLAMPALHSISPLSSLLLPLLVQARQQGGPQLMTKRMKPLLAFLIAGSIVYLGLLLYFRSAILNLCYAGKYLEYGWLPVFLVGLLPITVSLNTVLACGLRALERPDWVFWGYVGSSAVTLVVGIPLSARLGIVGALSGVLFSSLTTGLMALLFYTRYQRRQEPVNANRSRLGWTL
jgi:O-antigen/teichoic acid export membrane protein